MLKFYLMFIPVSSQNQELALRKVPSTFRATWTHVLGLLSTTDFQVLVESEETKSTSHRENTCTVATLLV